MLKEIKQTALSLFKASGGFTVAYGSGWRRRRLLILGYHGVAIDDEQQWNPSLYMSLDHFARRLEMIKKAGCAVLPLSEGLRRLYSGDLPEKSVVLTFDDGGHDFFRQAHPLLREFNFPVTLYLTTFHCFYNRPVFNVMCSYLLWKGRRVTLKLKDLIHLDQSMPLSDYTSRIATLNAFHAFANENKLSAEEKEDFNVRLAFKLGVDYDQLLENRILQILTPEEVRSLSSQGVDIQLHTHRHRVPLDRELFIREIEENRHSINAMTGSVASHFCYPSGVFAKPFHLWLRESGIRSATTCQANMATTSSDPFLLPRLIDTSYLSEMEFEGWLAGICALFPQRYHSSRTRRGFP
ncbi:MAG: polysaccharide deacetylase family protein [Pyrinomonadaceae bacterium]